MAAPQKQKLELWEKEDAKATSWREARSYRTKHYRVLSNLPRFIVELEISSFLDELYETYVKVFREHFGLESKAANQKLIKIHAGYGDYAQHEQLGDGAPPRTTPGFIVGGDELVVFYEDTDPGIFYGTVFHEGAHQFMSAVLPGADLPPWLDEAMATYFEGCSYSRATKKITIGFLPPDRVQHAKEMLGKERPAEEGSSLAERLFFEVPRERFEADHYALAWSFVYYLLNQDGGKYRKHFAAFLKATNGAGVRGIPEVFKRATKLDLGAVERGWREFVLALKTTPAPVWCVAEVTTPDEQVDLRSGDRAWSVGGVEVFALGECERLWKERSAASAFEVVVLRRTPVAGVEEYRESVVTLRVPEGSRLSVRWNADFDRSYNLRD